MGVRLPHGMALLLALSLAAGCGGTPRRPLAGTVTLDGVPLATGLIQFEPAEGDGLTSGAVITAGRYEIPGGRGLPPGRYRVRISAAEESRVAPATAAPGEIFLPPGKDLIPARYNAASELVVEIGDDGERSQDFDLKSR
jgi:hypothetical protein